MDKTPTPALHACEVFKDEVSPKVGMRDLRQTVSPCDALKAVDKQNMAAVQDQVVDEASAVYGLSWQVTCCLREVCGRYSVCLLF